LDPIYIYPDFFTSSSISKDPKNAQTSELFLTVYYFHQVIINIQQDAQDRHKFEIISAIKITTRQSGKKHEVQKINRFNLRKTQTTQWSNIRDKF